jgi:hypothetical protein
VCAVVREKELEGKFFFLQNTLTIETATEAIETEEHTLPRSKQAIFRRRVIKKECKEMRKKL